MSKTEATPLFTSGRENQPIRNNEIVEPPKSTKDISPKTVSILRQAEKRRERRDLVTQFEAAYPTWTGYSAWEITVALESLRAPVLKYQAQPGSQAYEILKGVVRDGHKFYEQSALAVQHLELALLHEDDETPSPNLIRKDPQAKDALAEYLLAKQFKERAIWNPKVKRKNPDQPTPREKIKQPILDSIENDKAKPDEQLVSDWREAHSAGIERREFWGRQLQSIADIEIVQAITSEAQPGR